MQTALEKQSPSGVGVTKLLSASAMLTAVEAAEDLLHLSVIAPPARKFAGFAGIRDWVAFACERH